MSFERSGLPANAQLKKAYNFVKNDESAIESAKIIFEECPNIDPEILAGHLMCFNSPQFPQEQLEQEFSPLVMETINGTKEVYTTSDQNLKGKPHLSPVDGVKLSFLAIAVLELEYAMEEYGQSPLGSILMSTAAMEEGVNITQDSVGDLLQRVHDHYEKIAQPMVQTTSAPALEQRFERALQDVKTKLSEGPQPDAGRTPHTPRFS
jgi:hypothetical protein